MKLLLLGDEASPSAIRMELTSENDLFFNYTHTLEPDGFRTVQEAQKLMVEFGEYPSVLTRMLDTCIREPHSHLAVFVMQRGGRGHLDFIQNMEYKFVELLSTAFIASDEETVRQNITFRYNSVKSRLALMQAPPASPAPPSRHRRHQRTAPRIHRPPYTTRNRRAAGAAARHQRARQDKKPVAAAAAAAHARGAGGKERHPGRACASTPMLAPWPCSGGFRGARCPPRARAPR